MVLGNGEMEKQNPDQSSSWLSTQSPRTRRLLSDVQTQKGVPPLHLIFQDKWTRTPGGQSWKDRWSWCHSIRTLIYRTAVFYSLAFAANQLMIWTLVWMPSRHLPLLWCGISGNRSNCLCRLFLDFDSCMLSPLWLKAPILMSSNLRQTKWSANTVGLEATLSCISESNRSQIRMGFPGLAVSISDHEIPFSKSWGKPFLSKLCIENVYYKTYLQCVAVLCCFISHSGCERTMTIQENEPAAIIHNHTCGIL